MTTDTKTLSCDKHEKMIERLNVAIMGDKEAGIVGIVEWRNNQDEMMRDFKEILDTLTQKEDKRSFRDNMIMVGVPSVTLTLLGIINNMARISQFVMGG